MRARTLRVGGIKRTLDPLPRVALVPGLGLFGLGRSKKEAGIAADLAQCAVEIVTDAEAVGRFQSISEDEMFDMEYWPLEQAKLGAAAEKPLAGQIAVITGAGGAIGAATASAFAAAGAEVALLDVDRRAAEDKAEAIGPAALALACDVTNAASVRAAFDSRGRRPSAGSTSWCRTPAPPGRAASARSTKSCYAKASS